MATSTYCPQKQDCYINLCYPSIRREANQLAGLQDGLSLPLMKRQKISLKRVVESRPLTKRQGKQGTKRQWEEQTRSGTYRPQMEMCQMEIGDEGHLCLKGKGYQKGRLVKTKTALKLSNRNSHSDGIQTHNQPIFPRKQPFLMASMPQTHQTISSLAKNQLLIMTSNDLPNHSKNVNNPKPNQYQPYLSYSQQIGMKKCHIQRPLALESAESEEYIDQKTLQTTKQHANMLSTKNQTLSLPRSSFGINNPPLTNSPYHHATHTNSTTQIPLINLTLRLALTSNRSLKPSNPSCPMAQSIMNVQSPHSKGQAHDFQNEYSTVKSIFSQSIIDERVSESTVEIDFFHPSRGHLVCDSKREQERRRDDDERVGGFFWRQGENGW